MAHPVSTNSSSLATSTQSYLDDDKVKGKKNESTSSAASTAPPASTPAAPPAAGDQSASSAMSSLSSLQSGLSEAMQSLSNLSNSVNSFAAQSTAPAASTTGGSVESLVAQASSSSTAANTAVVEAAAASNNLFAAVEPAPAPTTAPGPVFVADNNLFKEPPPPPTVDPAAGDAATAQPVLTAQPAAEGGAEPVLYTMAAPEAAGGTATASASAQNGNAYAYAYAYGQSESGGSSRSGGNKAPRGASGGPVLNAAGHAPPGLNKDKGKGSHGPSLPPAPPPPAGTGTGSGAGTGSTGGSGGSSSTGGSGSTGGTSSSGGAININIGGTGSTSGAGGTGTGSTGGSGSTGGTGGTGSGAPVAGTAQTVADFGQITINGHTTYLGSVQAPYMTTAQASQYVAGAINADQNSAVSASVNDQGQLQLTSKDGSAISIDRVGVTSTGDLSQLVDIGLQQGTYGGAITAGAPTSPYFADTFDQVYSAISSGSMTAAPAMNSTMFAPATATAPTATYAAPAPTSTSTTASASSTLLASAQQSTLSTAPVLNPIAGQTNINQPISAYSQTDFGSLTINGKQFNLGSIKTIDHTQESAAQYLANVFNVQGGGMLTAQASGSQLILNSTSGSALTVQQISPTLDLSSPQNRFGFAGFYSGQLGAGSLTGGSLIL